MDQRLAPSSMRTVNAAKKKWEAYAQSKGYGLLIRTDDPKRGSKLAGVVR